MPLVELNLSAERNRTKPSMFALVLYQPRFLYVIHLGHWDAVFRKKKKKKWQLSLQHKETASLIPQTEQ